jgi:surface antigen
MQKRLVSAPLALLAAGLMTLSCTTTEGGVSKTGVGALGGAVAGGLLGEAIGGHTIDVVAGAAAGALLGGVIGNVLDQRDRKIAAETAQRSLETSPTGYTSSWDNPDSGHAGSFTPTNTYQRPDGSYCREYTQEVIVGGEKHQAYGTACRQPDGTWQIVK